MSTTSSGTSRSLKEDIYSALGESSRKFGDAVAKCVNQQFLFLLQLAIYSNSLVPYMFSPPRLRTKGLCNAIPDDPVQSFDSVAAAP